MDVDRLRDYMQEDIKSWNKSWQDIDKELNVITSFQKRDDIVENDNTRSLIRNSEVKQSTCKNCGVQTGELQESDTLLDCCQTSIDSSQEISSRASQFLKISNRRSNFEIVEHPFSSTRARDLQLAMTDATTSKKRDWPSKKVNKQVVEKMVKKIWDTYLSETSHLEICVSPLAIINTVRRISHLDLYGPDTFAEALLEPLRTIQMDILPRFFASKVYLKMRSFQLTSNPLPTAKSLFVPPPKKSKILNKFQIALFEDRHFDLNEILQENFLYLQFLKYLDGIFCSENLLCVRMILIFEEEVNHKNFSEASRLSWYICNYFVRAGAPFEISLVHSERKEILLHLATPNLFMFSYLKRTAIRSLDGDFKTFTLTDTYSNLGKMLIQVKKQEETFASFLNRNIFVRLLPLAIKAEVDEVLNLN
jgi:hypothetical protein